MALSSLQLQLLQKMNVPKDMQEAFAYRLGEDGLPKSIKDPDFLMLLTDQLQKTESNLQEGRRKLILVSIGKLPKSKIPGEEISQETIEDMIKQEWTSATALWRTTDQVVAQAKNYAVTLSRNHVKFALEKKNLSVLEMIRFAKPEFFKFKEPSFLMALFAGYIGILTGISGVYGGFVGGAKQALQNKINREAYLYAGLYALWGIFRGFAKAIVTGARMGLRTGSPIIAVKLGYAASYINPFNDVPGSKYQQEEQLFIEETLFNFAMKD